MADKDTIVISGTSNPLLDFAEIKNMYLPAEDVDIKGYFPAISNSMIESTDKKVEALAQHVDELEQDISFFNDRREKTDNDIALLFQKHNELKVAVDVLITEISELRKLYSTIEMRLTYLEKNIYIEKNKGEIK